MTSPWNLCRGERMPLPDFQPMIKGVLRGTCRFHLPSGLVIRDASAFVGRRNVKPAYLPVLADRFSEAAIALIRPAHPGDLAD
jgi:hypothetical protein